MGGLDVAVKTFCGYGAHAQQIPAISTFIVKIYELCNINCTYCYMYNLKDVSFANRPKRMSNETRDNLIKCIREHATRHSIEHVSIVLHGGEPLLAGKTYLDEWVTALREGLGPDLKAAMLMHTNGILIDKEWVALFRRHNIKVGVSLDGPQHYNDKYRLDRNGGGTFTRTMDGFNLLFDKEHDPDLFGNLLSVASPEVAPSDMWRFWLSTGAKHFDFLLPHCTHDDPPAFGQQALSQWMIDLFDIWWEHDDPEIEIRYFQNIVDLILGSEFSMDYLGGKPAGMAVIESDGAVTGYDTLRACEEGLVELGITVNENCLDDALAHPIYRLCNHSGAFISEKCRGCRVREVCGGGFITHRYSHANGFNNPSIYCESLFAIISHIEQKICDELHQVSNVEELVEAEIR